MKTKKNFIKIAKTISKIENIVERNRKAEQYAEIFAEQNPRFDYKRFYSACNVKFL